MLRSEPGNGELKHREMLLLEATSIDRDVVQGPSMGIARGIPMQEGLHCKRVPTARGTPQCIARRMWHMPAGYALCFLQHAPALPSLPVVATCCFPGADLCQALRCRGGGATPQERKATALLGVKGNSQALPGLPHFLLHPHRMPCQDSYHPTRSILPPPPLLLPTTGRAGVRLCASTTQDLPCRL